jgi:DNA-directed RNA polymerase specialized sigma24 family protein
MGDSESTVGVPHRSSTAVQTTAEERTRLCDALKLTEDHCRVTMASETTKEILGSVAYASTADFERIFTEDMSALYLLSLLLTGDRDKAEECFVASIGESTKGKRVFKEWARSWVRRTMIQSAIRLIAPRHRTGMTTQNPVSPRGLNYVPLALEAEVCAILELTSLERFVFVMLVLERYSEHDCSILLGCSRRDVASALARALQQLGRSMNSNKNEAAAGSEDFSGPESSRLVIEMTIARYFSTLGRDTLPHKRPSL